MRVWELEGRRTDHEAEGICQFGVILFVREMFSAGFL